MHNDQCFLINYILGSRLRFEVFEGPDKGQSALFRGTGQIKASWVGRKAGMAFPLRALRYSIPIPRG